MTMKDKMMAMRKFQDEAAPLIEKFHNIKRTDNLTGDYSVDYKIMDNNLHENLQLTSQMLQIAKMFLSNPEVAQVKADEFIASLA